MRERLRPWAWPALFAGLAVLYALARKAYFVGFFNDDAFYLIGARSLLGGRYAELNAPDQPPLVNYMPGYSLLLAPVLGLSRGSLAAAQAFSAALLLAALWLCRARLWDELPAAPLAAAVLVAGLNPLAVSMSGTVLSDVPFLFLSVLSLCLARGAWDKERLSSWAAPALAAGLAALVRPSGAALIVALVLALTLERRFGLAAFCGLLAGLAPAAFLLRNLHYTGRSLMYFVEFASPYRGGGGLGALWSILSANLAYYPRFLFVTTLFRWPFQAAVLDAATIGLCLGLVAIGVRDEGGLGWRKFGRIFLAIFVLAHLLWSKQAGRYLLPVAPFAAAYLFRGLGVMGRRAGVGEIPVAGALALSLLLCAAPDARIVHASLFERTPLTSPPERTLAWIRDSTPEGAVFAAELDGRLYLLTGRPAVHLRRFEAPGEFRRWLAGSGAGYVLVFPNNFAMKTPTGRAFNDPTPAGLLESTLAADPDCRLVFEDEGEGAKIYRVGN